MRRFAIVSMMLVIAAAFLAAWVNAQEATRLRSVRSITESPYGGDFVASPTDAPARLHPSEEALPIDGELHPLAPIAADEGVIPTAGPAAEIAQQPTEASVLTSRRPLQGGSRLGPTVLPAAPVPEPPMLDDEGAPITPIAEAPSVLKRRAGTPPTPAAREARLAPTTIDANEPIDPAASSRRPGSPAVRSQSIRSIEGGAPRVSASATPPAGEPALIQVQAAAPALTVDAVGPQSITLGKPASYQVRVANASGTPAEGVEVRIGLPGWVALQGGEGTRGDATQETDATGRQWLVWSLTELDAGAKEELTLELVAQQNQPFELALSCHARPSVAAAEISVREPQIAVRLEGPSNMLYGEQKTFTLHVSNPGTGDAEGVFVEVASGIAPSNRLEVGSLAAGQQKQIAFTVAANAPGQMEIVARAFGSGDLSAEAASRVIVHKPELQVAVDVPSLSFAGTESTFEVAVANVGDALAEQVVLHVALPRGAKYLGGLDGAATAADGLTLKMGNLAPNTEKVFAIRCTLAQSGENRLEATAQGSGELIAHHSAVTQVEALADLKLHVEEPSGPMPVGGEAVYQVRLVNRGTKAAEKVRVVVQFGPGIEPVEAQGGKAALSNGQAVFEPLAQVAAGSEVVLTVKARIEKPGNQAFRVEVKGGEPEAKLVSEGVTRCFAELSATRATARKPSASPAPGTLQPTPATKMR
jgi:hypothetical protein